MPDETMTVRVPATFDGARDAAMTVRAFLDRLLLPPLEAARFELAVAESVNNIVEHSRSGPTDCVDISLTSDGQFLSLVISDDGVRADPDGLNNYMTRPEDPDAMGEGGRGLMLIRTIMDHAVYTREASRNVLTMTARIAGGRS
jgi:anti-sigma regulatory factor (Ser/Thr protein kinase)